MNREEMALLEGLLPGDAELAELWKEHEQLEDELARLRARKFVTPDEEVREREIRKRKLAGRDRIQAILRARRAEA